MFPLFTTRCLHFRHDVTDVWRKWELWARMLPGNFAEMTTSTPFRDLLHAANLRHGTDGFTSPPKESVLRIFSLRPGLNPRTWVLKASTLPLDHRSRFFIISYLILLRMRNFSDKRSRENQNTHCMFNKVLSKIVQFVTKCGNIL